MNKQDQIEELAADKISLTRQLTEATNALDMARGRMAGLQDQIRQLNSNFTELVGIHEATKAASNTTNWRIRTLDAQIEKAGNRIDWLVKDRNRLLNNNIALKAKYNSEAARWSRAINNSKETMSNVLTLIDRASVRNRETKEATDALATELGKTQYRLSEAISETHDLAGKWEKSTKQRDISWVFNVVLVAIVGLVIVTARIATS